VDHEREVMARAIHDDYVRRQRAEGHRSEDDPSLAAWESLPETLRDSNRHQSDDIEHKMAVLSYQIVEAAPGVAAVGAFGEGEVEHLAELEHERWTEERRAAGWTLGPVKDVHAKRSPYLVPWAELSEEVRDLDRDTVRRIPQFLATLGFAVVRRGTAGRAG